MGKGPQRLLSATVDTQTPAGPKSLAGRPGVSVTHCTPFHAHSLGVALGHTISRDCNRDTARRRHKSFLWGPGHNQRTADREEEQCHAHTPHSIRAAQGNEAETPVATHQQLHKHPQGVTVTHRHSVHAHGRPHPGRPTHGGLTRQGRAVVPTRPDSCRSTRSARGVPRGPPDSGRPVIPRRTVTPRAQTESPHTRTPRGPRPSHAQLAPGPGTEVRPRSRPRAPAAAEPRPRPRATPRPPARAPGAGNRRLQHPSGRLHRAPAGRPDLAGQPAAGANPGVQGGPPAPLPRLRGQPGRGGSRGGAWVPAGAPASRPAPTGQEAGPRRPAEPSCPSPRCAGTWDEIE